MSACIFCLQEDGHALHCVTAWINAETIEIIHRSTLNEAIRRVETGVEAWGAPLHRSGGEGAKFSTLAILRRMRDEKEFSKKES